MLVLVNPALEIERAIPRVKHHDVPPNLTSGQSYEYLVYGSISSAQELNAEANAIWDATQYPPSRPRFSDR